LEVYLDHNATTPLRAEVAEAAAECAGWAGLYGNPSSVHSVGRRARQRMEESREFVAHALGAESRNVTFTGCGSEAINLAIKGAFFASERATRHVVTSQVEHSAALKACRWLETIGCEVTNLPVDPMGRLDPQQVAEALTNDTVVVTLIHADNEVGTLQPTAEIGALCRERGVPLHMDAIQAVGKAPVSLEGLQCDMLSVSAHKFYGPKGVGALVRRDGTDVTPLIHGGGQERGARSGTEAVAQIVGLAKALQLALEEMPEVTPRLWRSRERLLGMTRDLEAVKLNGHPEHTLPHTVNLTFMYCDGMALGLNLSLRHIYLSQGSACTAGDMAPSHVLMAMGLSEQAAHGAIRFSIGRDNTDEQLDYVVSEVVDVVRKLRILTAPEDIGKCDENCPCFTR
jgi:cysteine desulfurase